jgi:hypothetical protein
MTDVPFVACTLMALLCYIRAMRRGRAHLVWWGGAWAFAAFLDRQIGVLTPLAALPLLVPRARFDTMTRSTVLLAAGAAWGAMFVCSLVMMSLVRPTGEMMKLVERVSYVLQIPVATYVSYNLFILCTIAFYALPALLAMAGLRGLWRRSALFWVLLAAGALMLGFTGELPVPLRPGNTWTLLEVGGSRGLINGRQPASETTAIEIVLRGAGLLAFALALMSLRRRDGVSLPTVRVGRTPRPILRRLLDAANTIPMTTRTPLVIYLVAYLLIANVLWMYNDRYLIVLLPIVVALALGERQRHVEVPRLAYVALAVFAMVAVAGTRDALRFNQSVRDSWQALVESGVRPSDIDAGYAWNGWVLYAHPENLAGGLTVQDVPWITTTRKSTYILSKSPVDGYDISREVTWDDDPPWPGPDRLLVLKRQVSNCTAASPRPAGGGDGCTPP